MKIRISVYDDLPLIDYYFCLMLWYLLDLLLKMMDGTYCPQIFVEKAFYDEEKSDLFKSSLKTFIYFLKQRESLRNAILDFFNTILRQPILNNDLG